MAEALFRRRLDSWKEIADYLRREVRTAIRWEKEKGLPVYRVPGGARQAVFAYTDEIDAWLLGPNGGWTTEFRSSAAGHVSAENELQELRDALSTERMRPPMVGGGPPGTPKDVAGQPAWSASRTTPIVTERLAPRSKFRRTWLVIAAVALLLVFAGLPIYLKTHATRSLARVSFTGDKLLAWDEQGRLAWEYQFHDPLYQSVPQDTRRLIRFVDLNGDGSQQLLATVAFSQPHSGIARHAIYCFAANGKLLWSYQPQFKLKFAGTEYEGPWRAGDMLVSPEPGAKTIWVAFNHMTWWPSLVVRLDPRGGALLQLVNSGAINYLDYVANTTGHYVLAAGLNNEYRTAALAVIQEDQLLAVSPQTPGSPYSYDLMPVAANLVSDPPPAISTWPYRYFLFQPSELFRLQGGTFHQVIGLNVRQNGIEIQTFEGKDPYIQGAYVPAVYEFAPDFELRSASLGDDYWNLHRQLEKEGKLHHSVEQCPDRINPSRVRMWMAIKGWETVRLPAANQKN